MAATGAAPSFSSSSSSSTSSTSSVGLPTSGTTVSSSSSSSTPTFSTSTSSSSSTTSTSSSTTTSAPPTSQTTTTTGSTGTSNSDTSTSNGSSLGTSQTDTTAGLSTTVLSVPSTSVGESTAVTSSNGQLYTTTLAFTTTIAPGTVITASASANRTSSGSTDVGAIVGGVVGGIAALIILVLLLFFCLRKRRKDEFDGNFDPAHVNSVNGGGGGTLPKIDLGEGGLMGNSAGGIRVDEDDGMGGRLGTGAGGGGIIVPYSFKPTTPIGGGSGVQYQNAERPQMQQMANIGVAASGGGALGYPNEKRAMRQTPNNPGYPQQTFATPLPRAHSHTPSTSLSISSGSHYPASSTNLNYISNENQPLNPNNITPEPYVPGGFSSATSDRSSSVGGRVGYYQLPQSMGGPSPGHSVLSSSSGNGERNAKEMEAVGRVVSNPDDGIGGQYLAFQAYLQNGPGPHQQQQQQYHPSSSSPVHSQQYPNQYQTAQSQTSPRPGTAVVVHEDGGRVVLRKGGEGEGEGEALNPEIPPTYDSLPVEVRRDG